MQVFGFALQAGGVHAGGVEAAHQGACAGAGNDFHGDIIFFQHFNHADMGEAFGCAAAQGQADNGLGLTGGGERLAGRGLRAATAAEEAAGGEGEGEQGEAEAAAQ